MSEIIDLPLERFYEESAVLAITKTVNLVTLIEQLTTDCPLCGGHTIGATGIRLKHKKNCPIMETLTSLVDIHEAMTMKASTNGEDFDHFILTPNRVDTRQEL